ncbi:SHOCT domain-containing protein [Aeromicrobium alkaliterrae]|uniref:SHOCT domain-containing protein n=1 Tax=Aeromicrobium alkaliterrae TaxID=302168 RepID=A0ABP4VTR0_9ACTN
MTEYVVGGTVLDLRPDCLVITNRGLFGAGEKSNALLARTIPLGAIREVLHRERGAVKDGYLWLVLGDEPAPDKPSPLKAMESPNAVLINSRKKAKAADELAHLLRDIVAMNRASGVDPASVDYDKPRSGEEILAASTRVSLEGLGLRDDVAEAASALMNVSKPFGRILTALSSMLDPGEQVEALTTGATGGLLAANAPTVLVLTDSRVLTVRDQASAPTDILKRSDLTGVSWQAGPVGRLDVLGAARTITLRGLDNLATRPMVEILRAAANASRVQSDAITDIERLVALRDAGALTPQEFETEKARVLGSRD